MYLPVGHGIKSTKQRKCTLINGVVSLKHVHETSISQHGLNNRKPLKIMYTWS